MLNVTKPNAYSSALTLKVFDLASIPHKILAVHSSVSEMDSFPIGDILARKNYDELHTHAIFLSTQDDLDKTECAGLTFERFQPKLNTCAILSDGSAILEAHKKELLLYIQRDKLPKMFVEFTHK